MASGMSRLEVGVGVGVVGGGDAADARVERVGVELRRLAGFLVCFLEVARRFIND